MSTSMDEAVAKALGDPDTVLFKSRGHLAVVNADLDGDGKLDLAVLDAGGHLVKLCKGDGKGGFQPAAVLTPDAGTPSHERLTARETDVAGLLAGGYSDPEIASMLGIGRRTVETHTANIRAKLGLKSRRELIRAGVWPAA